MDAQRIVKHTAPEFRSDFEALQHLLPTRETYEADIEFAEPLGLIHGSCKTTSKLFNDVTYSHAVWQQREPDASPRFAAAYVSRRYRWSDSELGLMHSAIHEVLLLRRRKHAATDVWCNGDHIGSLRRRRWPWRTVKLSTPNGIAGSVRVPIVRSGHPGKKDVAANIDLYEDGTVQGLLDHKYPDASTAETMGAVVEALSEGLWRHDWFPGRCPPPNLRPIFGSHESEVLRSQPQQLRTLVMVCIVWLKGYHR
ncbi:MAG: hypothetical protein WD009_04205 [Phycisphaeraceae bacterium]